MPAANTPRSKKADLVQGSELIAICKQHRCDLMGQPLLKSAVLMPLHTQPPVVPDMRRPPPQVGWFTLDLHKMYCPVFERLRDPEAIRARAHYAANSHYKSEDYDPQPEPEPCESTWGLQVVAKLPNETRDASGRFRTSR
jgi:hypothetical protein